MQILEAELSLADHAGLIVAEQRRIRAAIREMELRAARRATGWIDRSRASQLRGAELGLQARLGVAR